MLGNVASTKFPGFCMEVFMRSKYVDEKENIGLSEYEVKLECIVSLSQEI